MLNLYPLTNASALSKPQVSKDTLRHEQFIEACKNNRLIDLKKSLKKRPFGEKVNLNYAEGEQTPLCLSAAKGHIDVIRVLLAFGASINLRNDLGKSPLMEAVISDQKEIVILLWEMGAHLEPLDLTSSNVLHYAADKPNAEMLHILLKNCKNALCIDQRDREGKTPLHLAIQKGRPESVKALLGQILNLETDHFKYVETLDFTFACSHLSGDIRQKVLLALVSFIQDIVNRSIILFFGKLQNMDILSLILKKTLFTYTTGQAGREIVSAIISQSRSNKALLELLPKKVSHLSHVATTENTSRDQKENFLPNYESTKKGANSTPFQAKSKVKKMKYLN